MAWTGTVSQILLEISNNNFTNTRKEILAEMLSAHFLDCSVVTGATLFSSISNNSCGYRKGDTAKKDYYQ